MIHQIRWISLIFRTFHPNAEEYTFFSSAHGTLYKIDHILGHKSNPSKFKKIEIIPSIFSKPQHYETKCQLQEKEKTVRNIKTWRLNNILDEMISLISSGHSIQMRKNTPSSQVHMEHSLGQTTSLATNQVSISLRKLKSYQVSLSTML